MDQGLVSEARPIPWEHLSGDEKKLIEERADTWIQAVVLDAARGKAAADVIDEHRSGRVLFIDGPRGAGKTSLLLTLLKHWTGVDKKETKGPCNADLHVFLPVLDFDPLPHGMPLHGWLLEPWRKEVKRLDAVAGASGHDSMDLTERLSELFERAVTGWTPAYAEGKGVVEKALAYQEQASGWLETAHLWSKFVDAAICRTFGCFKDKCTHDRKPIFVIAIDDIDLQVEQIPRLLHAIRLLHHPNVVYVLTGDHEHLRFVLTLDYVGRHERITHVNLRDERPYADELWLRTKEYSRLLSAALLEKALPSHARLTLERLSAKAILTMAVGDESLSRDTPRQTVGKVLAESLMAVFETAGDLPIATAREAQHSIDRHMGRSKGTKVMLTQEEQLEFVADLCGTTIQTKTKKSDKSEKKTAPCNFMLRGRVTTLFGARFRVWGGEWLRVILMESPLFAFDSGFDGADVWRDEKANRTVLVQLVIEKGLAEAVGLVWNPDEGVVATEVTWRSELANIEARAIFRWPWLVRPPASGVLDLQSVAQDMSSKVSGNSQGDLTEAMVVVWLSKSLMWGYERKSQKRRGKGADSYTSFKEIAAELEVRHSHGDSQLKSETTRWLGEVLVMTAPYFGLPEDVADAMRNCLDISEITPSKEVLRIEQTRMVTDAIILGQVGFARSGPRLLVGKQGPSSAEYDAAANEFLREQEATYFPDSKWWQFLYAEVPTDRKVSNKSAAKNAPAKKTPSKK